MTESNSPGHRIRRIRIEELKVSQAALANASDVATGTIGRIERGYKCVETTQHKIIEGMNKLSKNGKLYTHQEVFK